MPQAAAIGGAAVLGYVASERGSKRAANATRDAAVMSAEVQREGIAAQREMFDISSEHLAPWREVGEEALNTLRDVYIKGDMTKFFTSPQYNFVLSEGNKAIERKQAAAGTQYGGAALKEAVRYSEGVAAGEFGSFYDRLNNISNQGENAAARTGAQAIATGQGIAGSLADIGNTYRNQGNTIAQIEQNRGTALNNTVQGTLNNLMTLNQYQAMQNQVADASAMATYNANPNPVASVPTAGFT